MNISHSNEQQQVTAQRCANDINNKNGTPSADGTDANTRPTIIMMLLLLVCLLVSIALHAPIYLACGWHQMGFVLASSVVVMYIKI